MFDFLPPVLNGTLREHYLVLFSAAGSIALVAGLVGAWLGARFGTKRVVQAVLDVLPSATQQEIANQQLFKLSDAVDTMSVEIERLSEGQRYAARLLAERGKKFAPAVERPPGVITPH